MIKFSTMELSVPSENLTDVGDATEVQLFRYSPSKIHVVTTGGKKTAQMMCFLQRPGHRTRKRQSISSSVASDTDKKLETVKSSN